MHLFGCEKYDFFESACARVENWSFCSHHESRIKQREFVPARAEQLTRGGGGGGAGVCVYKLGP